MILLVWEQSKCHPYFNCYFSSFINRSRVSRDKSFPMLASFSPGTSLRSPQPSLLVAKVHLRILIGRASDTKNSRNSSSCVSLAIFECHSLILVFSADKTWHSQTPKMFPGTLFKLPLSGIPFLSEIPQQFKLPNIWNFQKIFEQQGRIRRGSNFAAFQEKCFLWNKCAASMVISHRLFQAERKIAQISNSSQNCVVALV